MPKYQVLYFERKVRTKTITAKRPEAACDKFMKFNRIDEDNLTIDYELRNEETGEDIDIRNIESVKNFI